MPQMAPMNWFTLFLFFSSIFMLINTMNFYLFNYKQFKSSAKMNKNINKWKW